MGLTDQDVVLLLGREASAWLQLLNALTLVKFDKFDRQLLSGLICLSLAESYEEISDGLSAVIDQYGLNQVLLTESYDALSACYYGGVYAEKPESNQEWLVFNSPLYSELASKTLDTTELIVESAVDLINDKEYDLVRVNLSALEIARSLGSAELMTSCLQEIDSLIMKIVKAALDKDCLIFLTSTCSGSEAAIDVLGDGHKFLNTNALVPFVVIGKDLEGHSLGQLDMGLGDLGGGSSANLLDIAPTVLSHFGIAQPSSMSGKSLI